MRGVSQAKTSQVGLEDDRNRAKMGIEQSGGLMRGAVRCGGLIRGVGRCDGLMRGVV